MTSVPGLIFFPKRFSSKTEIFKNRHLQEGVHDDVGGDTERAQVPVDAEKVRKLEPLESI
jgi:hypothetical protein